MTVEGRRAVETLGLAGLWSRAGLDGRATGLDWPAALALGTTLDADLYAHCLGRVERAALDVIAEARGAHG